MTGTSYFITQEFTFCQIHDQKYVNLVKYFEGVWIFCGNGAPLHFWGAKISRKKNFAFYIIKIQPERFWFLSLVLFVTCFFNLTWSHRTKCYKVSRLNLIPSIHLWQNSAPILWYGSPLYNKICNLKRWPKYRDYLKN